jgi:hypothetical protein
MLTKGDKERRREMDEECHPKRKTLRHKLVLVEKIVVDQINNYYVKHMKEYVCDYDPDEPTTPVSTTN